MVQTQRWAWTHTYAVPLFVASVVGVLLSGAALTAVLWLERGGSEQARLLGGPGGGLAAAACLAGSWQVVEYTQEVPVTLLGSGRLDLAGPGPVYEFQADGTGRVDYGTGVRFDTVSLGETVPVVVTGHVEFQYEASDDIFRLTASRSHAEAAVASLPLPWELSTEPVHYTCTEETAAFSRDGYSARYERITS